ncbi:MAG: mechanosensitive ion channel family protein [Acidobacteria bacterium]|nr:mechanosensitive ion channel family protein [Acidobacteriota bacterium]
MESLRGFWDVLMSYISTPLLKMGSMQLSIRTFLYLIVFGVLLIYISRKLTALLADRVLAKRNIDIGVRQATATILRYLMIAAGFIIIFQTAGIDLTALNVLAGAVGIGVGFGLQNIANNFISGLIILFERPIKVGDRIEVGDVEGDVIHIKARSTTVVTNDNIAIIIPNSSFVTQNVINWSHTGNNVRFKIPVSVSYDSDVRLVEKLLLEVAAENPDVLRDPAPAVRFLEFGESGLLFELRAWSSSLVHRKGRLISSLNFGIIDKFRAHSIEIPYPQRDIHIRSKA